MSEIRTPIVEAPATEKASQRVSPLLWAQAFGGWDRVLTPPLTPAEQMALSDPGLEAEPSAEEREEYVRWFAGRHDLEFNIRRLAAQVDDEQLNGLQRLVNARDPLPPLEIEAT